MMTATAAPAEATPPHSRRNVIVLALSLALSLTGVSMILTISPLVGHMLADDKRLATLPLGIQYATLMASTVPASLLMARIGRRAGFMLGQMVGLAGAAVSTYAVVIGSFPLFTATAALFGVHSAFWQYYRFAAAETASEAFRGRAISLVMSGGVVAAVAGPELAKFSRELLAPVTFAGSYAAVALLCAAAAGLLRLIRMPAGGPRAESNSGRPLGRVARQPMLVVAVLAAMVSYGVMALVMVATPVAMMTTGHSFADSAFVIQWHLLGMYVPSFFTGHLIQRAGVLNVIVAGALLILACVGINLTGTGVVQFWAALALLGLGWNFMFIGGTTLLTQTYRPIERAKVQALNDFMVFSTVAVATFASGAILGAFGWAAVNYAVIAPVLVAFLATVWLRTARCRSPAAE